MKFTIGLAGCINCGRLDSTSGAITVDSSSACSLTASTKKWWEMDATSAKSCTRQSQASPTAAGRFPNPRPFPTGEGAKKARVMSLRMLNCHNILKYPKLKSLHFLTIPSALPSLYQTCFHFCNNQTFMWLLFGVVACGDSVLRATCVFWNVKKTTFRKRILKQEKWWNNMKKTAEKTDHLKSMHWDHTNACNSMHPFPFVVHWCPCRFLYHLHWPWRRAFCARSLHFHFSSLHSATLSNNIAYSPIELGRYTDWASINAEAKHISWKFHPWGQRCKRRLYWQCRCKGTDVARNAKNAAQHLKPTQNN